MYVRNTILWEWMSSYQEDFLQQAFITSQNSQDAHQLKRCEKAEPFYGACRPGMSNS